MVFLLIEFSRFWKKEAFEAVKLIQNEKVLGFDTETRAAFRKGERYDISLLQLATSSHAFLFRLNKFRMIPELIRFKELVQSALVKMDDDNWQGVRDILLKSASNQIQFKF